MIEDYRGLILWTINRAIYFPATNTVAFMRTPVKDGIPSFLDKEDLYMAAVEQILRYEKNYDPKKGSKTTYLSRCIRTAIEREILGSGFAKYAIDIDPDKQVVSISALTEATGVQEDELEISGVESFEDALIEKMDHERLAERFNQLPDKLREVMVRRYVHNKTYAQIGEELGISTEGVRLRLARGEEELRKLLKRA